MVDAIQKRCVLTDMAKYYFNNLTRIYLCVKFNKSDILSVQTNLEKSKIILIKFPMDHILKFVLSILVLSPVISCQNNNDSAKKPPNIVFIMADDLGWADVGFNGNEFYETPNIDQLASQGMVFHRFYPSAANCAPTRASLLTGMYSPRHDVYLPQGLARGGDTDKMRYKVPTRGEDASFNTFEVSINTVDPSFVSLAEMLKEKGYVSARLGKWHIGDDNQGFDVVSSAGVIGEIFNKNGTEKRFYDDTTVARKLTDAAIQFIEENQDNPFFVYLSHWEVHLPLAAREERIEYYRKKTQDYPRQQFNPTYAAEVEQVDWSVGRVMDKLKALDLEENTMVVFTSDNGGLSDYTSNAPLRAGKGTFYEGGIRTPMCIKWPATIKPETETDIPVNGIDFMPTFAAMAGIELPAQQPVDGISILPILKGEEVGRNRPMYFHFPLYLGGGGSDAVLPAYKGPDNYWRAVPSTTIIQNDWKLIYYYEYDDYELYNLKNDIGEKHDLSKENPEMAKKLIDMIHHWTKVSNAPIPNVEN